MSSAARPPADRFAPLRRNPAGPALSDFQIGYPFGLDDFQRRACEALEEGRGVLVAAPTGAGKTVVGEFAAHLALRGGNKCFYTTPIKALSNQKYADLVARHGPDRVGLLTGDNAINGDADVVVMTTEVLRNMLYARSTALTGLSHVVMDEVHYLADRNRGGVWEEVIIHLPEQVRLVSLSATVSNAEEFAEWLVTVRGDTEVVVEEHRPVPLWQHVMVGTRLYDLFIDDQQSHVNPELLRVAREELRWVPREKGGRPPRRHTASRPDVIERLDREGLLPAITFVFSRAGCAAAVEQCLRAGLRLTTPEERDTIRAVVDERTASLPEEDLRILGYWEWLDGLERGLAAHHAGMLPTFKEVVEELFTAGLVKAVFATETLALGINMPARSVVLEKLVKWNGDVHADVTPGEYTQLTGRAGRRGIDVEGHAVVLWQHGMEPKQVGGLASTRTYPLRSSFRPSYNMAVNLVGSVGREPARALLESSFAQFQADRSVVGIARQIARNLEALAGYQESMSCHLGDLAEYAALRTQIARREGDLARQGAGQRRAAAAAALERLKPGDVVRVPSGRRSGLAVVLDPGVGLTGDAHPLVVTEDRWAGRLSLVDFPLPVEPVARLKVSKHLNHRSPQVRRDLASALRSLKVDGPTRQGRQRSAAADDEELSRLRAGLRRHPVHGCSDREAHLRWSERWHRLRTDTDGLERTVEGKTSSIARTFDRVCAVLEQLGYLAPATHEVAVTEAGTQLSRVYSEADLLTVECLRAGDWDALTAAELAAVVSTLVYEARRPDESVPRVPSGAVEEALDRMRRTWSRLSQVEAVHQVAFLREPDAGFTWTAWRWASGTGLEYVLADDPDLTAGDFVRWCKQLVDLLGQIADVAPAGSPVRGTARQAVAAVRRGVVSYSSVV
ncbi:MAG: DEAD/DEAH box helicase [Actinomycetota bacterium]|nr:DEAD/DEAH box helicase [Actinomycetota bacterium]